MNAMTAFKSPPFRGRLGGESVVHLVDAMRNQDERHSPEEKKEMC